MCNLVGIPQGLLGRVEFEERKTSVRVEERKRLCVQCVRNRREIGRCFDNGRDHVARRSHHLQVTAESRGCNS